MISYFQFKRKFIILKIELLKILMKGDIDETFL